MARQVDGAAVMQSESALCQQQRHLNGDAVVAIVCAARLFGYAQGIVGDDDGGSALVKLIPSHSIVV